MILKVHMPDILAAPHEHLSDALGWEPWSKLSSADQLAVQAPKQGLQVRQFL